MRAQLIDPGSGSIHDRPGFDGMTEGRNDGRNCDGRTFRRSVLRPSVELAASSTPATRPFSDDQANDPRVAARQGPVTDRRSDRRHHQPRVIALRIVVQPPAHQALDSQIGFQRQHARLAEDAGSRHIPACGQDAVQAESQGEFPARNPVALVQWESEGQGMDQVGRDAEQDRPFAQGFEDQSHLAVLQVAEPAMDQAAGARAGAGAEVTLVDEGRAEAAHGRVAEDARPRDAAADDQEIELPPRQVFDRGAH